MIAAILKEIHLTSPAYFTCNSICDTIYFGGGTPSMLPVEDLTLIIGALYEKFSISSDIEITLEANPDDISTTKLQEWKKAGINRLSVGIQSFLDAELVWMNRAHTAADALRCIDEIKDAGFTNFSIDLIYGSPLLSNETWMTHVNCILAKQVPHLSGYALTVEPNTALHKMIAQHSKAPVEAAKQAEQFMMLMHRMQQEGYEHYEISNFAKPGLRSRHNSSYWQGKAYIGFGPSAHSYNGESRKWNVSNNALYIQSLRKNTIPFEEELLTKTQQLNEYIMISLRTIEGIDLQKVKTGFGNKIYTSLLARGDKYLLTKKIENKNSRFILTNEGKLFADGITADLFF